MKNKDTDEIMEDVQRVLDKTEPILMSHHMSSRPPKSQLRHRNVVKQLPQSGYKETFQFDASKGNIHISLDITYVHDD